MAKKKEVKNIKKEGLSYQETYKVEPLYLSIIIVNRYQGDYYLNNILKLGASTSFLTYGKGTAPNEFLYMLGVEGDKKDVVISLIKESLVEKVDELIEERFNVSKTAKGISFMIKFDSIMGVLPYKFLTDTRINQKKEEN